MGRQRQSQHSGQPACQRGVHALPGVLQPVRGPPPLISLRIACPKIETKTETSSAHVPEVVAQPRHLQQQQVAIARRQLRLALPQAGAHLTSAVRHAKRVRKPRVRGACRGGGGE